MIKPSQDPAAALVKAKGGCEAGDPSRSGVDFKTVRRVHATTKSHLNRTVLDTRTLESGGAFRLEESPLGAMGGVAEIRARRVISR